MNSTATKASLFSFFFRVFLFAFFCGQSISFSQAQCISTYPHTEGFETAATWTSGGTNNDWTWGTPSKTLITVAASGTKCWITGGLTSSSYASSQQSYIVSPCYNFTTLAYPHVRFKLFWEIEKKFDGGNLQYSLNNGASWINVGTYSTSTPDCMTAHWFNNNNIKFLNTPSWISPNEGWSGNMQPTSGSCLGGSGSGGWVEAQHCLNELAGKPSVQFRFTFGSGQTCNSYDGLAIDDFTIEEGTPNDPDFSYTCNGINSMKFTAINPPCPIVTNYLWNFGDPSSGAANTSTLANPSHIFTSSGNFSVSLTTSGGPCNAPGTITQAVPVVRAYMVNYTDVTCYNADDGTAIVGVSNGTLPIVYSWSPTGGTTTTATGLAPGLYTVQITDANNCTSQDTITIHQPNPLSVTTTVNSANCSANGSATTIVTGGVLPYSYLWSPTGGTASTAASLAAGTYTITVTDNNNCTATATSVIASSGTLAAAIASTDVTCYGYNDGAASINPLSGVAPYTYLWSPSGGSSSIASGLSVGNYTCTVTDNSGCSASKSVTIQQPSKVVTNVTDTIICGGGTIQLTGNAIGGTAPYTYAWNNSTQQGATIVMNISSTTQPYNVITTDAKGCSSSLASATINSSVAPIPSFNASILSGCAPLCVDFNNTTLGSITNANWSFGDGATGNSIAASHCYTTSSNYTVSLTITTANGCTTTATKNNYIKVLPKPTADFTASAFITDIYDTDIYFYDASTSAISWNWNIANDKYVTENTEYNFAAVPNTYPVQLIVENQYGCKDSITKTVYIKDVFTFYAPNAFTPNNDGFNEVFSPTGMAWDTKNYSLSIYDRWGKLLFNTTDATIGWNGKIKNSNDLAPLDVYVWAVQVTDIFGNEHTYLGSVTLVK